MAKAKFHKSQRVFVKPVGTWAYVEAVVPKWVKGCDEPINVTYDCGMGREFAQMNSRRSRSRSRPPPQMASAAVGGSCAATIAGKAPTNAGITLIPARIPWS